MRVKINLPPKEGWNHYVAFQKKLFDRMVSGINMKEKERRLPSEDHSITFIQGRKAVFEQCIEDLNQTQKEAKFIVLGLKVGISPELMLAQKYYHLLLAKKMKAF